MILLVLLFLVTAAILILDQTKFYCSEALESDHAAYEIEDSWMLWFKRISHLNGL